MPDIKTIIKKWAVKDIEDDSSLHISVAIYFFRSKVFEQLLTINKINHVRIKKRNCYEYRTPGYHFW